MSKAHYVTETQIVRRVAADPDCRWRFQKHALRRMNERDISAADIQHTLMSGQVVLHEVKRDILWRVEGRDVDGMRIAVVAAVEELMITIKVITVF